MRSLRLIAVVLLHSAFVIPLQAATFTVSGTTLQLNLTAANETVAITAGATNYTFALTGGTWSGTDSADATGNGTASLSAVKASFTAVTVDDVSTGNGANFNNSGANTYTSNFTITLDSTAPGTSTFTGTTAFSDSAALFIQSGGITANASSVVSVVNGNLSLIGNMQTPGRTGNFDGVNINSAQVTSTGTGNVTIRGKTGVSTTQQSGVRIQGTSVVTGGLAGSTLTVEGFGSASTARNEGVFITGTGSVTTLGGSVVINGTGGSGSAMDNKGFMMDLTGTTSVAATGNGSITITGNGGGTNSTHNVGVEMLTGAQIITANGNLSVTGIGGGGGIGANNYGIWVAGSIKSTGSGNVSVIGTGGPGSGGSNFGVIMQRNGTGTVQEIKSGTGNVTVIGTAGGGTGSLGIAMNSVSGAPATISTSAPGGVALVADSMSFVTSAVISAPTVSIAPKTPGKNIDLGSTSDTTANTLGLSQTELNAITATSLNIGDANTAVINLSAAITLPGGTTANLAAAAINVNGHTISGGTVRQTVAGQPDISVNPLSGAFGSLAQGSTQDIVFTLGNVGFVDLTGISVSLAGANQSEFSVFATPAATVAAGGSTTFTVRFAPATAGSKVAAVQIASNDPDENPAIINLTGSSLPDISVEQPAGTAVADGGTKDFGGVAVGSTADLVFTVMNPGTSDLAISGITFDGTNASNFSVFAAPSSSVPVSGSTTFTVRYSPTSIGSKTAALHIASNVPGAKNPYDINLTATAFSPAPLSGTKSVGPTGDYTSLTQAITDIQAAGLGGALVLELQSTYVSTVETFPLAIPALTGASATNTLTIRPASGATGLSISSANSLAQTVELNGAQFVTFDGRPGGVGSHAGSGVGTASQLTIANTNGRALRFFDEASGNTLRYTTLRGVIGNSTTGIVVFVGTTGANGNDNNTIDHCDIREGGGASSTGIYSLGSTGTSAQANSGNTVSNCNVFNFYSTGADAAGVRLDVGNTDWSITGNSFYQTASRAAAGVNARAIYINNTSGNNFTVTGNFIGGTASNAGGTAWTTTGTTVQSRFVGIHLNVGTTTPSSVQGNTIANIVWTSSSTATTLPGVWSGIYVQAGNVNVGTVTANTIGSGTGTGSISVTTSGSGGTSFGIGSDSSGTVAITGNSIGSITVNGSTASISASLTGIRVTAGTNTISNNTVGSTTTANSLNAARSSTSTTGQQVTGILSSSSTSASITGNTVANLNNNYVGSATTGQIRGIVTSNGVNTITGNTVRNLSTTSANTSGTTSQSGCGIIDTSTTAGQTVSQNTVHSLENTAISAAVSVTGIYFAGPTSGTNVVARNFVHSLAVSSSSASSALNGMQFAAGTFTAQNNLVRVGLKADGTSTAGASAVRCIFDQSSTVGRNFHHNSLYLGGTQTAGTSFTVTFYSLATGSARAFQNNIFVNARSNGGGTGNHLAVLYGTGTGLTAGGNILFTSGTGGVLAQLNGVGTYTTLAAWQTATGQDATSAVGDPNFVAPTGTAATVDLHLQTSNPAEGGGIALTDSRTGAPVTATDDFDGQTRSTLTPADVGADAGDFTLTPGDLFPPGISYPLLSSGSTANRVLTGWATITDNSGSVSSGVSAPRLYYKKSTDADVFGGNTSADNGWKYVTATGSGPYSFTLDYSLLNGGSVSAGDTVQYFVVAQDAANNLSSSPAGATASATPSVQNVNGHGAVNSFSIVAGFSGTKTVGSGGDYPSLSGAGGLFATLNASVLTGNVVVNITSDTTEDGGVTLNELISDNNYPSANAYTLTLQPDSATMRTISGTAANGLITLNGADRVTIDGRSGGSGRYLTFRNTSTATTASTILFINDASNNTVRNCVVEGANPSTFVNVIGFSTASRTGNNNNLITENQVRDLSTTVGVPAYLIGSLGSAAFPNTGNTLSNNECFNFSATAIYVSLTGNANWTLSGNDIYDVNEQTAAAAIEMNGAGTNLVTQNYIHDLRSNRDATSVAGITVGGSGNTTVSRNRIVLNSSNALNTSFLGLFATGSAGQVLTAVNNQITIIPSLTLDASPYGILVTSAASTNCTFAYNSVVIGGTASGSSNSWALHRQNANACTTRNNLFLNLRTGGSGGHFAAGSEGAGGSYTASNNVYAGTGTTAANFMDFSSTQGTAVPVSYATWQSSTGDTSSQAGIAGSGNFTAAMFVSAATGDLHLVPGGNALVNGLGTPIAGVTTDYDGDARSATTPNIGADELVTLTPFQAWAAANSTVANNTTLPNFAFGTAPGVTTALAYTGNFAGGGAITATGTPITAFEPTTNGVDFRALFVRRKDYIAAGLTYTPQFSANVTTWQDNVLAPTVLADDGTYQIVSVPYPPFIGGKKARFFRISITVAP